MTFKQLLKIAKILFILYSTTTLAEDEFALCKPESVPARPQLPPPEGEEVRLFSNQAVVQEKSGQSIFSGEVLMQRGDQILKAPLVTYDRNQDSVDTPSDFTFWERDFVVQGANLQLQRNQGQMEKASYWLLNRRARGFSEKIILESKDQVILEKAMYTTCDPHQEAWSLKARQVVLDKITDTGKAYHVQIQLGKWPVIYVPYLSFPLSEARKSGLLEPSLGSSDETGTEISWPYYFNLAPHYDATLTPRLMSRRGVLLKTELRYLTQQTGGNLEMEYLPHDKSFGKDRGTLTFRHQGPLVEGFFSDINLNYASDNRYFEELGNTISAASITHLERRAEVLYEGSGWNLLGRVQGFQTLDRNPASRPYQRLPQLLFNTTKPEQNRQLNTQLRAELVNFERDTEVDPVGERFDFKSIFSYPWRTSGTFLVPKLSLRYTLYHLSNLAEAKDPERGLFTFSTDSGLFLERHTQLWETPLLHTLEPRLFYRYTPYRNQTDLPIFDTARYNLSFGQLFREDSFSGPDRVDDNHQVTLAVTSRLLGSETGIEYLRGSLGQSYYFRDRRVTLPEQPEETTGSSSVVAEIASQLTKAWTAAATWQWNPHTDNTEHTVLRTRYHPAENQIVNLSYRLRAEALEQTDVSWYWPLGRRWKILGRWNYSLPEQTTLETFGGLEYNSCCWAVRGIMRRYLNNVDGSDYLNGFFLQFEFKGLGGLGKKAETFLEQRIPGYDDRF